jgi:DNA-binding beta-propeller fold protein YncE
MIKTPNSIAAAIFAATTLFGSPALPAGPTALTLEKTIDLPGVTGRIDHMAVDLKRRRLFVAELGNGTVDVIDLAQGRSLRRIGGLDEPQGLAYLPASDQVVVATGGDGKVRFYAGPDLAPAGEVDLGDDADNVRVDEASGAVVVGYGAGGLAIIDPARRAVLKTISLGAHPEGIRLDPKARRAFVNVPNGKRIAAVDLVTGQVKTWSTGLAFANFPMSISIAEGKLATVFRTPAQLALVDMASGAITERHGTCSDSDDVFFDPPRRNLYVSCGQGVVEVFHRDTGPYTAAGRIQTRAGARTSLFVPELDRLFVAARAADGAPAAILIYKPANLARSGRAISQGGN